MPQSIQTVHLIFKTHLDVGFTDFAQTVTTSYFENYIPSAIRLAQEFHERPGKERFVWTTGSWLIYEYLERATNAQRKLLEDAILAGDIVWHGLPFTTHTELMDASLFKYGLSLSQTLDKRFGRKTIAAKMTDVPGHTRAIVPLLAEAGIRFLHLGANAASTPPDVPNVFRWMDGATDLMVMYQKGGYGDLMTVAGLGDAIAFAHTNDNEGPQTFESVLHAFRDMRKQFPRAKLTASTMDAFAEKLLTVKDSLPVVTAEMGDTWIQGVGSDPTKVSQYRELLRLRKTWLDQSKVKADDPTFGKFSRSLMMIPEHTWGMDEKTHLRDYTNYDARSFRAVRREEHFQKFESSWAEQRAYLTEGVDALGISPLRQEALGRLAAIKPQQPTGDGFQQIKNIRTPIETTHFSIGFDAVTGAVNYLTDQRSKRDWASAEHLLAAFTYETFSQADYDAYWRDYIINKRKTRIWSLPDNTKIGISAAQPESKRWQPQNTMFYQRSDTSAHTFLLFYEMANEASNKYGCPRVVTLQITLPRAAPVIHFDLQWFEKRASRLPEALWMSFNPIVNDSRRWQMDKLGKWISPLDVIKNGNRHLHAVGRGVRYQDRDTELLIETLDAPLVAPGDMSLLHFNNRQPVLKNGMHFNLYNNIWATNFPMWFEDDARFRFILRLG